MKSLNNKVFCSVNREKVKHSIVLVMLISLSINSTNAAGSDVEDMLDKDIDYKLKSLTLSEEDGNGSTEEPKTPEKQRTLPYSSYSDPMKPRKGNGSGQASQPPRSVPPKLKKQQPNKSPSKISDSLTSQEVCQRINNRSEPLEESQGRVALFRGIHYVKNLFDTQEKIDKNLEANDIGTYLVSSAACKLTGIDFLADAPGIKELEAGKLINKILSKFKGETPDLYHKFHETYTNNHEKFHLCLKDPDQGKDMLTKRAFTEYRWVFQNFTAGPYPDKWSKAVKRNPFVSFSTNVEHALKYALGQKSFTGGGEVKLLPEYNSETGTPKNKYLGKLYIAILSPADIWRHSPTFVMSKHAQNKVDISTHFGNNILPENEVSFFGYVPGGIIQYSEPLEMCEFTSYDSDIWLVHFSDKHNKKESRRKLSYSELSKKKYEELIEVNKKGKEKAFFEFITDIKRAIFENEAIGIISNTGKIRIYPDVLEGYYTHLSGNSEQIIVSHWLHSINAGNPVITSMPQQGIGGAKTNNILILATNLIRQPSYLKENWAGYLTTISIAFCELGNSGPSFAKILNNFRVCLKSLSLKGCSLTASDTKKIAEALPRNKFLHTLILDGNKVEDAGAEVFAKVLKAVNHKDKCLRVDPFLKHLSLYNTGILNIKPFADLFPKGGDNKSHNRVLIELNLDLNLNQAHLKQIQKGLYCNLQSKEGANKEKLA